MSSPRNGLSRFDRLASSVAGLVAKAWFFGLCALIVLIWAPAILFIGDVDTWQLIINTMTTIVTFLLVALLQNTQYRSDQAVQKKLNALVEGLAAVMDAMVDKDPTMEFDIEELRRASGLEEREGT